ncbi:hypothetical protein, partial [Aromatoleum evansii]|uniref:hypothetical protein n=1 Tax=Aromatoleum evansii TaxID=59406 RepID=UPI001B7D0F8A
VNSRSLGICLVGTDRFTFPRDLSCPLSGGRPVVTIHYIPQTVAQTWLARLHAYKSATGSHDAAPDAAAHTTAPDPGPDNKTWPGGDEE